MKQKLLFTAINVFAGAFFGFLFGYLLVEVPAGTPSPLVAAGLISAFYNGVLSLFACLYFMFRDRETEDSQFNFARGGARAYLTGMLVFVAGGICFGQLSFLLIFFSIALGFFQGLVWWQLKIANQ